MKIEIDETAVTDKAYVFDRYHDVIHAHGGVATRVHYKTVREMDIATFVRKVVPRLKDSTDDLVVLRNASAGSYSFLLGDRAVVYDTTNVEECELKELSKLLKAEDLMNYTTNVPWPLVYRRETPEAITVTIRREGECVPYTCVQLPELGTQRIWLPPVWFKAVFTSAGGLLRAMVAVNPSQSIKASESELYWLPLGNFYPDGQICLGSSVLTMPLPDSPTEGQIVAAAWQQVFGSNYQAHLLNVSESWKKHIKEVYDALPEGRRKILVDHTKEVPQGSQMNTSTLERLIAILGEPDGWKSVKWEAPINVSSFLS